MSKRKERQEQFQADATGVSSGLSGKLVRCGLSQLTLALDDPAHALGSVLLSVAAFEAWLNELVWILGHGDPRLKPIANRPIISKYGHLVTRISGEESLTPPSELQLVVELREEIAHWKPRVIPGNLPDWLAHLDGLGLLRSYQGPDEDVQLLFSQKLMSYDLAYWVWQTLDEAVANLCTLLRENLSGDLVVCQP